MNEITYHQEGDYFIPDIELPKETHEQIGKYGRLRKAYLKNYHSGIYTALFLKGTLYHHLADIDQTCNERIEYLIQQMAEREGVTEAIKASAQLEWVSRMNNIKNRAEEIICSELIYT